MSLDLGALKLHVRIGGARRRLLGLSNYHWVALSACSVLLAFVDMDF